MGEYVEIIKNAYIGYAGYLWQEITNPNWHNYFYWLIGVSLFFFALEWVKPWRKDQPKFRKDFWMDFFYMFFNFFLFSLIIYNAASDVVVTLFCFCTPLIIIHRCCASMTTATPSGCSVS